MTRHRSGRWVVAGALLAGVVLFLLWRFDPGQASLPVCGLYATTGLHCPGCGATRALHQLLRGRLLWALHCNAFWVLSLPPALYLAASEARRTVRGRPLAGDLLRRPWFWISVAGLAVIFFVLRNLPFYPFDLLAPPD